ncbi:MAG: hypothetical protein KDK39_00745 [Leptospiraceae bacterium]|nr:hypothetical protein [Leptospiraceae bacterium]
MQNLKVADLTIETRESDSQLMLVWEGEIHMQNPREHLEPYLASVLDYIQSHGLTLECDFRAINYMNSASIPPIVQFLRSLATQKIQSTFFYDSNRKVHAASFRALDVIASKSEYTKIQGL